MRFKNLIGFLVVITILFSYVPVFSMDGCPEGHHMGNIKMDCGYTFHCPMIVIENIPGTNGLPLNGLLVQAKPLFVVDEVVRVIFHPPKDLDISMSSGMKEQKFSMNFGTRNCLNNFRIDFAEKSIIFST